MRLRIANSRRAGFLADSDEISEPQGLRRNALAAATFRAWDGFSHRVLFAVAEGERSARELVAITLFTRLIEGSQSAFLLLERGLEYDARVLVRVNFETLVLLLNACKDPAFPHLYVDADEVERLRVVKAALRTESGTPEERREAESECTRLEERLERREIRERDLGSLARKVDLLNLFDSVWRLTSSQVHVSPRAISEYLIKSGPPNERELDYGPARRDAGLLLDTLSEFLKRASGNVAKLFERKDLLSEGEEIWRWATEQRGGPLGSADEPPAGARDVSPDRRRALLEQLNAAYATLRRSAGDWGDLQGERGEWDATLSDGLPPEGPGEPEDLFARIEAETEER